MANPLFPADPTMEPTGIRGLLGNRDLALSLLANSGYGPKRSFGQILGQSALQAQQMSQARQDEEFKRRYMEAQMQAMQNKQQASPFGAVQPDKFTPESLKKFEETGKYGDLVLRNTGIMFGRYNPGDFTSDSWAAFVESGDPSKLSRYVAPANPTVEDLAGGRAIVQPSKIGGAPRITPLTSLDQEINATAAKKSAEAQASAIGAGQGAIQAGIQTKGSNAKTVLGMLQEAETILKSGNATGSLGGTAIDKVAGAVGKSTRGAKATAQLQVLQAGLMLNMPRMEGPQSDRDVELYRQAAASLGDPTVPDSTKLAALQQIRALQIQYAERAANMPAKIFAPGSPQDDQRRAAEFNSLLDKYAPRK